MDKATPLTVGVIGTAASIVLGWLWLENHFMPRADAESAIAALSANVEEMHNSQEKSIKKSYLEVKIDLAMGELKDMEGDGTTLSLEDRRKYNLLSAGVERMQARLMELEQ